MLQAAFTKRDSSIVLHASQASTVDLRAPASLDFALWTFTLVYPYVALQHTSTSLMFFSSPLHQPHDTFTMIVYLDNRNSFGESKPTCIMQADTDLAMLMLESSSNASEAASRLDAIRASADASKQARCASPCTESSLAHTALSNSTLCRLCLCLGGQQTWAESVYTRSLMKASWHSMCSGLFSLLFLFFLSAHLGIQTF